jgi:hypothetical protein
MPTKREIEAELQMNEREKAIAKLRETIADLDQLEADLQSAEALVWQPHWSHEDPLPERMLRVGVSRAAVDKVKLMFDALEQIVNGEPLPKEAEVILNGVEKAEQSAAQQIAAIVARGRK